MSAPVSRRAPLAIGRATPSPRATRRPLFRPSHRACCCARSGPRLAFRSVAGAFPLARANWRARFEAKQKAAATAGQVTRRQLEFRRPASASISAPLRPSSAASDSAPAEIDTSGRQSGSKRRESLNEFNGRARWFQFRAFERVFRPQSQRQNHKSRLEFHTHAHTQAREANACGLRLAAAGKRERRARLSWVELSLLPMNLSHGCGSLFDFI